MRPSIAQLGAPLQSVHEAVLQACGRSPAVTSARALAVLSLVALLPGCPRKAEPPPATPPDAGPARRTEAEPNDRPEQSMPIGESTDVSANLASTPARPDEDWYLLFSEQPRLADVVVSGIPGTVVLLEAYDETRTRLAAVSGEGDGQPARFPNLTVKGKLLLRVSAARKGGGGAYTLSVRYGAPKPGMEIEPNDRHADATELLPQGDGWTIQGLYGSPGDEDHYRLVLDTGADAGRARGRRLRRRSSGRRPDATGSPQSRPAEEGFPTQPPPLGTARAELDAGTTVPEPPAHRAPARARRRGRRPAGDPDALGGGGDAVHRPGHGGAAAVAAQRGGAGDGPGHRGGGEERLDREREGRPPRGSTPSIPTP